MPNPIGTLPNRGWLTVTGVQSNEVCGYLGIDNVVSIPCTSQVFQVLNTLCQYVSLPQVRLYVMQGVAVGLRLSSSTLDVLLEGISYPPPGAINLPEDRSLLHLTLPPEAQGTVLWGTHATVFACPLPSTGEAVEADIVRVGDVDFVIGCTLPHPPQSEDTFVEIMDTALVPTPCVQCFFADGTGRWLSVSVEQADTYARFLELGIQKFKIQHTDGHITQSAPCITNFNGLYRTEKVHLVGKEELREDGFCYNRRFAEESSLLGEQFYAVDLDEPTSTSLRSIRWVVISSVEADGLPALPSLNHSAFYTGLVSKVRESHTNFFVCMVRETCIFEPLFDFRLAKSLFTKGCPVQVGDKITLTSPLGTVTPEQLQIVRPRPNDEAVTVLKQLVEDAGLLADSKSLAEVLLQVLLIVTTPDSPRTAEEHLDVPLYQLNSTQGVYSVSATTTTTSVSTTWYDGEFDDPILQTFGQS